MGMSGLLIHILKSCGKTESSGCQGDAGHRMGCRLQIRSGDVFKDGDL
jgi:hypothetical protein